MCATLQSVDEDVNSKTPYPFVGVKPKPGTAVIFLQWQHTEKGITTPEFHPSLWHDKCPFVGTRALIRSFRHYPELNCEESTRAHFGSSFTAPRRTDCPGV